MPYQKEPQEFRVLHGKNLYYKTHFHPQVELLLCTEGSIQLYVEDVLYIVDAGSLAVIFPNQAHSYMRRHEDSPSEAFLAIIPVSYVDDFEAELDTTFPLNPVLTKEELPPHFSHIFEALYEATNSDTSNPRLFKAFSNVLLASLMPRLTLCSAAKSYDIALTPRILNYLAANHKEPLSLSSVARTFGISKNTLSNIFNKELHTTYVAYLTSLRLETAKKLLKKTKLSMANVALESGFQSERSFYRIFREHTGYSPAQYRKSLKNAKK